MSDIQSLLSQVSAINKRYEKIAEITGENFNIFKILKLETSEVRTHSAFLAELLNPKGSHGQGDVFLKLFIKQLSELPEIKKTNNLAKYETFNATVEENCYIGEVNNDYTEGGFIDIVINLKNCPKVFIENKIYAGDQKNQLYRYHHSDRNALLIYLTRKKGDNASSWSTGEECGLEKLELNRDYFLLSYEKEIKDWLELCKKEASSHPLLRETISQYINLIKYLTNQTMSDEQNKDIIDEIRKYPEYIEAAVAIANTIESVQDKIFFEYFVGIKDELEKLKLKTDLNLNFGQPEQRFCIYKDEWEYGIAFTCWTDGSLLMGIYRIKDKNNIEDNLKEKIKTTLLNISISKGKDALTWGHAILLQNYVWLWQVKFYESLSWSDRQVGEKTEVIKVIKDVISALENAGINS